MDRKINVTPIKGKENQTEHKFWSPKDLPVSKLMRYKTMKKKGMNSPKLPSNSMKNKENLHANQQTKGSENSVQEKSLSKKKPKLEELTMNSMDKVDQPKPSAHTKPKETGETKELEEEIICEGVSKDGLYKLKSKAFFGQQLKKAVQLQYKLNYKAKHQKLQGKEPKTPKNSKKLPISQSKTSSKENGIVKGYGVNTNQGISRNYNEDRVSIILNITKNGVKSFYFAIYDGHGGNACCDFLNDHLHQYILNSKKFPAYPRQAIVQGIKMAERDFLAKVKDDYTMKKQLDKSGSCIILALIVEDQCYIANVGDSRAVLSTCSGKPLYGLSRDHKPTDASEQARILKEGGKIYRTQMKKITKNKKQQEPPIIGPLRVFPGKLSITRTIGDIEAKDKEFGGQPNCIITDPQICRYKLSGKQDFIILGCDGIFQRLDSEEVVEEAWKAIKKTTTNIHDACGNAAQAILRAAMHKKSSDNVTAIIICLSELGFINPQQYRSL